LLRLNQQPPPLPKGFSASPPFSVACRATRRYGAAEVPAQP
jgi:hypothetical protein